MAQRKLGLTILCPRQRQCRHVGRRNEEVLEDYSINSTFNYDSINGLSAEGKEKLKLVKPETLGQASRISGVSPADISIVMVYLGR